APEPAAPNASQETPAGTAEPEMPELSSNAVTFTFQLSDGSFKNISFDAKPVGIDFFKTTPMRVKLVAPDSLAEKAGVLPGWVLTHSQGEPLPLDFNAAILKLSLDLKHLKLVR
ncbi:CCDC39, partial [Symbiodinium sp. CCMP2456]